MIGKKVRLAVALAGAAVVATLSSVALPAAPASAAQCVNLTGYRDWDGWYHYAEVKNICSGTYHFRITRSDNWNTDCYTIQGGLRAYYEYATSLDTAYPTGIRYC